MYAILSFKREYFDLIYLERYRNIIIIPQNQSLEIDVPDSPILCQVNVHSNHDQHNL